MSRIPVPRYPFAVRRVVASCALLLVGCASVPPEPLLPADELERVLRERADATGAVRSSVERQGGLRLVDVWDAAQAIAPDLLDARAAAGVPEALAATPIPLPNPTLSAGPLVLLGADVPGDRRWGFEALAGWLLDLSGSRAAEASVQEAAAHEAAVARIATEREVWLGLRRGFVRLAHAERSAAVGADVVTGLEQSLQLGRRLVDAAQATALDVREFEIELHRARADGVSAASEEESARTGLAGITGLPSSLFHAPEMPTQPEALPAEEELPRRIVRDHPELARLRAAYDVAEAELRRAVRAGWPDLELESSFEREDDEETLGLGVGLELPLFDRNQPEIAERTAARSAARVAYAAELARRIAAAEGARRALVHARERLRILRDDALPAARDAVALSLRALQAGSTDALHVLSVARAERDVRKELIAAEGDLLAAWLDLEEACGSPFLQFASLAVPAQGADEGDDR